MTEAKWQILCTLQCQDWKFAIYPISFPELRSPWPAVGKREPWEQPLWKNKGNNRILVIRLTAHLHLWRMPEMVAPRALVFRPLVKGNEALGTRLRSTELALYYIWARTMKLFTWPSWELYLPIRVKLRDCSGMFSIPVRFHKDKPQARNKRSITLWLFRRFWFPIFLEVMFFSLLWRYKYVLPSSHTWYWLNIKKNMLNVVVETLLFLK